MNGAVRDRDQRRTWHLPGRGAAFRRRGPAPRAARPGSRRHPEPPHRTGECGARLLGAVAARRAAAEEPLRLVGQQLFEALFTGHVHGAYRASLGAAQQQQKHLGVVLRIVEPELAALPWEALFDPETGEYLCRSEPLIRHVDVPYTAAPPRAMCTRAAGSTWSAWTPATAGCAGTRRSTRTAGSSALRLWGTAWTPSTSAPWTATSTLTPRAGDCSARASRVNAGPPPPPPLNGGRIGPAKSACYCVHKAIPAVTPSPVVARQGQ